MRLRQGKATACALIAGLLAPVAGVAQRAQAAQTPVSPGQPSKPSDSGAHPAEIRVEGSRPAPPAHLDPVELFDSGFVNQTDAFTADEVLSQLSTILPGTQQLVLIDGQETTVDPSTIPAARIERIEVSTTGVMPDGRPRFVGTVINIILKERYDGANVSARRRDSFASGGGQSQFNGFGGYTLDKLSGTVNFIHREQDALLASERDFSRTQDYTGLGGVDYRAPYGTAAVVQSVSGPLNGFTDASGAPAFIALAPETAPGHPLTPADFAPAPAGTTSAVGLRHFNTSDFLYLVAPAKSDVAHGELTYAFSRETKIHAGYTFTRSESQQLGPPPVTPVGSGSLVPAAYNPFGQDVEVGLVNEPFGAVERRTSDVRRSGFLSGEGHLTSQWDWNGRFDIGHRVSTSDTRDLDQARFAAALAASDPAERFDPFAAMGPGSADAALYPSLTDTLHSGGTSDNTRLRLRSAGDVSAGWVGPIKLHLGADRMTTESQQSIAVGGSQQDSRTRLTSWRANTTLDIPVFKVRELEAPAVVSVTTYLSRDHQTTRTQQTAAGNLLQPLTLDIDTFSFDSVLNVPWTVPADNMPHSYQLGTRLGVGFAQAEGRTDLTEEAGALWSPLKSITLRADYSRQQAPTPTSLYPLSVEYDQILVDRRRGDSVATNVQVVSGQPDAQGPPLVTRLLFSAQWEPPTTAKVRVSLAYADVEQKGQQRTFTAQDILDNEAALTERVTRLPPTADDLASREPGQIVQVDITPFSGGQRMDRSLALLTRFSDTLSKLGTLSFRGRVARVLSSTNEIIAGSQVVSTNDQEVPPAWTAGAQTDLQHGKWGAYGSFNYVSGGTYAGLPYASFGTVDARVAYEIEHPLHGWLGRTLRLSAGIQNLFNRNPPFANTITGFHGGSPLGRTYELTVRALVGD
jgi:iron complex outermembrane recepter protein